MSLESDARKEFAHILTRVTRVMNGALDGKPWGAVGQDDITTSYTGDNFVCLDAFVQGFRMTMHASYDPREIEYLHLNRQRQGYLVVTRDLPKGDTPGYVIIAEPVRETISAG